AAGGVPQADRLVPARGGELHAVGGEDRGADHTAVADKRLQLVAGVGVPQLDRLVPARSGEDLTVRRESDGGDVAAMPAAGARRGCRLAGGGAAGGVPAFPSRRGAGNVLVSEVDGRCRGGRGLVRRGGPRRG